MAGHFPAHSPYAASKWGVVAITEGLYQQLRMLGSTVGVSCLCPGWVNTNIGTSERNRPEWAAPAALVEPPAPAAVMREFVMDQLRSGMPPDQVAELVHDAVVGDRFWIFTHPVTKPVAFSRFEDLQADRNPTNAYDRLPR